MCNKSFAEKEGFELLGSVQIDKIRCVTIPSNPCVATGL